MFYVRFLEQRAEMGTYDEELMRASQTHTDTTSAARTCIHIASTEKLWITAVAALMAIPTAVGWTGAPCCSC